MSTDYEPNGILGTRRKTITAFTILRILGDSHRWKAPLDYTEVYNEQGRLKWKTFNKNLVLEDYIFKNSQQYLFTAGTWQPQNLKPCPSCFTFPELFSSPSSPPPHSSTSELWDFADVLPFAWNVLYLLVNLKIPTHLFIISSPRLGPSVTSLSKCRWALWATLALCAESRLKMATWQHVWISSLYQSPEFRNHAFPSLYPNA